MDYSLDYWGKLRKVCDGGDELNLGSGEQLDIKAGDSSSQFENIKERLSKRCYVYL